MNRVALLTLIAAQVCNLACHEPFSNDDIRFLKSLPRELRIEVPSETQMGLRAAQNGDSTPASLHQAAVAQAKGVNDGIFEVLRIVDAVTAFEPTAREDDKRVWGPFPLDESRAVEALLVIDRVGTATISLLTQTQTPTVADEVFEYVMAVRRAGTETWVPIFAGRYAPIESVSTGLGVLFLDLDAVRRIFGTTDGGGIAVGYDTRGGRSVIEVAIDAVRMGEFDPDAVWINTDEPDGSGSFLFALRSNFIDGPRLELLWVAARWLSTLDGRADAVLTEGDADFPYLASECWNAGFERTYLGSNIPSLDFTPVGTPESCAEGLREPQFPGGG